MPKKKPSEKNKAWEKDRRDRLNKSFDQLAKLLPQYDPSITWSKIEIIQKSIEHIESLHKQHEDYLKSKDPEILKDYNKLIESIKYFKVRNEQLSELLVKAKISLPPASKIPTISILDDDKLIENNNFNNNNTINVKPVGRPGKYINKIGINHDNAIENNETNVNSIQPSNNNANKIEATIATEQKINVSTNKEKEIPAIPVCSSGATAAVTITSTNSATTTIEKGDIISTGILLPVISIQTQPVPPPPPPSTLKQSVITSQIISNPPIPLPLTPATVPPSNQITQLLPPLINVTNLSSIPKFIKNTTITTTTTTPVQIFNYAKDKNGKIKIVPKPQIKLYFRRADGKIPIPVLKRRSTGPIKRKRKRKCCSKINSTLKNKKRKIDSNNKIKINEKSLKDKKSNEKCKHSDDIILQPLFIKTENHNNNDNDKGKNKENIVSNTIPGTEIPNDFQFSELEIPQHETNQNSVSPTAAFLMSFPVVNTSNGRYTGIVDDNEILTPNLERKDHPNGVDNLENLNNFFTTKEYTKYCRENSEKNSCEKKQEMKNVTILEDIKFPSSSFSSNILFNPYSNIVTNSNNNSFNSIKYQACGSQSAIATTTAAVVGQGSIFTSTNSQSHFIPISMPNITSNLLDPLPTISTSDTLPKMNTCLPYSNNQQFSLFSSYSTGNNIPMPVITTQNSSYKKEIKTTSIASSNTVGISGINVASTQQSSVSIANKQNNSNTVVNNATAVITRSSSSNVDTSFLPTYPATTTIFYNNSRTAPSSSFSVASMSLESTISRTATISESETVSKASISLSESKISRASISTIPSTTVPVPNFNAGSFSISSSISQVDYLPPFHNSSYTMNKLPKSNDSSYVAENSSIKTTAPMIWTPSFVSTSSSLNSDFSAPALVYTTATITVGSGNFNRYTSSNLSQNPFNTSKIATYNSYTTNLTPRCTPLPLDSNLNNNIQSSLESCTVEDIVRPPPQPGKLKSQMKYAANKNTISTSISSVQQNVNIGHSIGSDSKSTGISNKLIIPSKSSSSINSFVQNSNPSKTVSNILPVKDTITSSSTGYPLLPTFTSNCSSKNTANGKPLKEITTLASIGYTSHPVFNTSYDSKDINISPMKEIISSLSTTYATLPVFTTSYNSKTTNTFPTKIISLSSTSTPYISQSNFTNNYHTKNTNNAENKDTTSSAASTVYTSLPVFTSTFNTTQSTLSTISSYSRTNEFNITNSICYSQSNEMSNLISSSVPSQSSGICSNISSTRGGQIFNHSNHSYRDYTASQNLLNSSSHIYPSTTNYYYPQTHSTFGLSLTTPSNVPSTQMDTSQNVLPYSTIKPDMSWMTPISNDYKTPSFSFSLTPTTSTISYKESNSTITSSVVNKSSNLPPAPPPPHPIVTKDNKNSTKSLFNMFTTTTTTTISSPAPVRYRPPGNLNTKESINFFPSTTTTISASLINTKPVNSTVNEIKSSTASTPIKQSQSIASQQCSNINNNNHFQPVSTLASSNNHFFPCNSQQQLETNKKDSVVYPMKSLKTEVSPQKPRNSFTIDATLGIAAVSNATSNNCYLENMKKSSNSGSYNGNSRDDNKTHNNRNKGLINNERNSNNNVSVQNDNNNFYECSEKIEKFNQKLHINNWMTPPSNKDIHMNTMDYAQLSTSASTSYHRMPTDAYHSAYGICEDNFSSWSPNKIYDTSHLIVPAPPPPTTTAATIIPNYYGDIHFNTSSTCHLPGTASGPADIIVKEEKNYTKSSLGGGGGGSANQTNFFSVSQLVDQGSTTNNTKECEGYQRKIPPQPPLNKVKNQGLLKHENYKSSSYLMNPSETIPSENLNCSLPIKAPFSNNYSAEALISKKEKHRNFNGMPSSEYYNPMDTSAGSAVSGILYNQLDINNEQNYNSNYFYNYPSSQNYPQDVDYLGGYTTDNHHFGKILNKHHKKILPLPPPTTTTTVAVPPAPVAPSQPVPPVPPPSNLISYESNYFPPVPLAVNSPFNPHSSIDGYHESHHSHHHHYNHSGNYQMNTTWGGTTGKTSSLISGYQQNQNNQHYQSLAAGSVVDINHHHMNPESGHHSHSSQQPTAVTGNLTNFNLSTICPEINDKVVAATPSAW